MSEDYGIKISKSGHDVRTATEDDIIITSVRNCLKVDNVVHDTITTDANGLATKTVTHSLGFVPVIVLVINYLGSFRFAPFADLGFTMNCRLKITSTTFELSFTDTGNKNHTFDFYYFLSETETAT